MPCTLLVTNDFPPRTGGIQTYLHALAERLPPGELVVYAPAWPGDRESDAAFPHPVVRHPTSLMLPGPAVAGRAAALVREHGARTVWFGAAAPLALFGPWLRRHAGVERVVASSHGHEVGWSMLPGSRHALRRIGTGADVVTTISRHTRGRVAAAFGPLAALEHLPSGIDTHRFAPDATGRAWIRRRHGLGDAPVVVCVSRLVPRKGQDVLIRALPRLSERVPGVRLLIVGDGPDTARLRRLAAASPVAGSGPVPRYAAGPDPNAALGGSPRAANGHEAVTGRGSRVGAAGRDGGAGATGHRAETPATGQRTGVAARVRGTGTAGRGGRLTSSGAGAVVFAGAVPAAELPAYYAAGDAFALPCRTRAGGLDIEGLGIVALEAAACGLPVVVGRSGGAPETVREGVTGHVVDGRDPRVVADALAALLTDPDRARAMGAAGRAWMQEQWSWPARVAQLRELLHGPRATSGTLVR